jgi:hypothetical protein
MSSKQTDSFDTPAQTLLRASIFSEVMLPLIASPEGPREMREYYTRAKQEIVPALERRLAALLGRGDTRVLPLVGRTKFMGAQLVMLEAFVRAATMGSEAARVHGLQAMAYFDAELKGITFTLDGID